MILCVRLSLVVLLLSGCSAAQGPRRHVDTPECEQPVKVCGLYLKVRLDSPLKLSKLTPGEQVWGKLFQDVYSGNVKVFPALVAIRLTVDRLDRRRRAPNDHWPWVIKAFVPRYEQWPVFHIASIMTPGGQVPLEVSLISVNNEVEVEPKLRTNPSSAMTASVPRHRTRRNLGTLVTLVASTQNNANSPHATPPESATIPAGTEAKIILLRDISATRNRVSDIFPARLVEPVFLESKVLLPEGTLFEGKVLKSQAPRTLSRSGSISLVFTDMTVPGRRGIPIAASIAGAQINQSSHTVIDPEGRMRGDRPGIAWMLLNLGTTTGIAKEADDGTQLIIESLFSTATDASTAGTARIISACVSAIFLLTRHGRDVVLPKYTQVKIVFDRRVEISKGNAALPRRN